MAEPVGRCDQREAIHLTLHCVPSSNNLLPITEDRLKAEEGLQIFRLFGRGSSAQGSAEAYKIASQSFFLRVLATFVFSLHSHTHAESLMAQPCFEHFFGLSSRLHCNLSLFKNVF